MPSWQFLANSLLLFFILHGTPSTAFVPTYSLSQKIRINIQVPDKESPRSPEFLISNQMDFVTKTRKKVTSNAKNNEMPFVRKDAPKNESLKLPEFKDCQFLPPVDDFDDDVFPEYKECSYESKTTESTRNVEMLKIPKFKECECEIYGNCMQRVD